MEKQQNGMIHILKFLFAGFIVVFHASELIGVSYVRGGFIGVEFFFLFCGYTLTKRSYDFPKRGGREIGDEVFGNIKKRILKIWPCLLMAAVLSFLVTHIFITGFSKVGTDILLLIPELTMTQMAGFPGCWATGVSWFLSAMFLSIAFVYPCILAGKNLFTKVFAPCIAILIYGYLSFTTGSYAEPGKFLESVGLFKGLLRGIAGISLGSSVYHISEWIRRISPKKTWVLLGEIIGWLLVFLLMFFKSDGDILFIFAPFFMVLLLSLTVSETDGISTKTDNRFTRLLGQASVILYLNHYYWAVFVTTLWPDLPHIMMFGIYFLLVAATLGLNLFVAGVLKRKGTSEKS